VLEESPQVQGLMDFGDSSVTARVVVRVKPGEQFAAERELRQRLKRTFDQKGIEIPFPQRTTHFIQSGAPPRTPDVDDGAAPSDAPASEENK
jgi:small conductance mechanosensitive channel